MEKHKIHKPGQGEGAQDTTAWLEWRATSCRSSGQARVMRGGARWETRARAHHTVLAGKPKNDASLAGANWRQLGRCVHW